MTKRVIQNEFESVQQINEEEFNFFIENLNLSSSNLDSMKIYINKFGYEQLNKFLNFEFNQNSTKLDGKVTLLDMVAYRGHTDLLKFLIEEVKVQANPTLNDKIKILHYAVEGKNLQNFQYLFEKESRGNAADYPKILDQTIMNIVDCSNIETLRFVFQEEANTDNKLKLKSKFLLNCHRAVTAGEHEIVKLFFENGVNFDETNISKGQMLISAVVKGHIGMVELLLEVGADIEQKGYYDRTPLLCAAEKGFIEIAEILLKNGADINSADTQGNTAHLLSLQKNHIDMAKLLIESGGNINAVDYRGDSLMDNAATKGHLEIVKVLLQYGAKVNLSNYGIEHMYSNKDFDVDEFISDINFYGSSSFKENYPIIKNHLLGAHWWQTVLSEGANISSSFKPFCWDHDIAELFKDILNNKIASASNFSEISTICKNIISSKEGALNALKNYSTELEEDIEVLSDRVNVFEELFIEINREIMIPIYGEDDNALTVPNLSILALIKVLSNTDDYLKIFEINPFAIDKAKIAIKAIKAKLVSETQKEKLTLVFDELNMKESESNAKFTNVDYPNEPYTDPTNILGDNIDNLTT